MTPIFNSLISKAEENPIAATVGLGLGALAFAPPIIRTVASYCARPAPKPILTLPPPQNLSLLDALLNLWVTQPSSPQEQRGDAKQRVLEACSQKSPTLDLSSLSLTTLPNCFFFLPYLCSLDCSHNPLTSVRPLPLSLTNLNLNSCGLKNVPPAIYSMNQLQHLQLANNDLTKISEKIKELPYLKTLNLYGNKLDELPKELGFLRRLETLDCGNNNLTTFPRELCFLLSTCTIYAFDNPNMTPATIAPFLSCHALCKTAYACPRLQLDPYLLEPQAPVCAPVPECDESE